jgi:uncharacterized protein involved in cysteine biosynthesis
LDYLLLKLLKIALIAAVLVAVFCLAKQSLSSTVKGFAAWYIKVARQCNGDILWGLFALLILAIVAITLADYANWL